MKIAARCAATRSRTSRNFGSRFAPTSSAKKNAKKKKGEGEPSTREGEKVRREREEKGESARRTRRERGKAGREGRRRERTAAREGGGGGRRGARGRGGVEGSSGNITSVRGVGVARGRMGFNIAFSETNTGSSLTSSRRGALFFSFYPSLSFSPRSRDRGVTVTVNVSALCRTTTQPAQLSRERS